MPLDPQFKTILDYFQSQKSVQDQTIQELRQMAEAMHKHEKIEEGVDTENKEIENGISLRIYTPKEKKSEAVLLFFHGGGWVVGSLETADPLCRSIATQAGIIVISADYRLAPEHKYPFALEDCYQALQWAAKNYGEEALIVAGDSAGGNLAAAICHLTRDREGPKLKGQILFYPVLAPDFDSPTYLEFAKNYFLEREDLIWSWDQYLPNAEDRLHPYASPLFSEDLSNLPPAFIITAEFDPLRYEGEAYAAKLQEFHVPVILKRYEGLIHGFLIFDEKVEKSKQALQEICEVIRNWPLSLLK